MKKHTKKEEKEMFRKELMKAGLIVAISILSLVGCSGEEETKPSETASVEASTDEQDTQKETQTETQEPTDELTTGDVGVGKFDPADVCKNISINGEVVEFPWTLNKLGDEYTFGEITDDQEHEYRHAAYLMYQGERMMIVGIDEEEEVDRDSIIDFVSFWVYDEIVIYNFGEDTTEDVVVKKLGQPDEINENSLVKRYTYIGGNVKLSIDFNVTNGKFDGAGLIVNTEND